LKSLHDSTLFFIFYFIIYFLILSFNINF
jgi:hypothetical protein